MPIFVFVKEKYQLFDRGRLVKTLKNFVSASTDLQFYIHKSAISRESDIGKQHRVIGK